MAADKKKDAGTEKLNRAEMLFGKEQIIASERYFGQRDLVEALLDSRKKYTLETVDSLIEKYKKGQVK